MHAQQSESATPTRHKMFRNDGRSARLVIGEGETTLLGQVSMLTHIGLPSRERQAILHIQVGLYKHVFFTVEGKQLETFQWGYQEAFSMQHESSFGGDE